MTTIASPRSRWLRLAGWQIAGYATVTGGLLLTAAIVLAVILAIASRYTTPTLSGMQIVQQIAMWFLFAVAIHYAVSWLGPHVAAGGTRRAFVKAAVIAAAGAAALLAAALLVMAYVEGWIYGLLGWSAGVDHGRAAATQSPVAPYLWGLFMVTFVAALTGLLVGLSYARWGAIATFALPLTMAPLLLTSALGADPATMFAPGLIIVNGRVLSPALGHGFAGSALVGVLIMAATVVAIHLLARRTPIRSPRA